jgi:hypothetical protein
MGGGGVGGAQGEQKQREEGGKMVGREKGGRRKGVVSGKRKRGKVEKEQGKRQIGDAEIGVRIEREEEENKLG